MLKTNLISFTLWESPPEAGQLMFIRPRRIFDLDFDQLGFILVSYEIGGAHLGQCIFQENIYEG